MRGSTPRAFKLASRSGPCVRKLFTGLIMYLPSQNKEHCIVLYCIEHCICIVVQRHELANCIRLDKHGEETCVSKLHPRQ